ncbi:MAG: dihydroorotate dehydrogenase electron transfer subunit [Selenomonadaceae bacterium]|nr:dihydroorotate dehydrogenase electron transfer subunit [Selenomonadaceae bacterium]
MILPETKQDLITTQKQKFITDAVITAQDELAPQVFRLTVAAPEIAKTAKPGQFVQIKIPGGEVLLRRPLGVADVDTVQGSVSFVYRVVGKGTAILSQAKVGEQVNILGALGHGFDLTKKKPLLVGGGMGLSPLLFLAKYYSGKAEVLMGGKNEAEMFWPGLFRPYVSKIYITTDDGSLGHKGFTVDLLPELIKNRSYDGIFLCGPEIMMEKAAQIAVTERVACEVSLERRMACGLGACLSCSLADAHGARKKVCKDGPVFKAEEVFHP